MFDRYATQVRSWALNNQTVAQLYCQTTGVLAGFALTALILVLSFPEGAIRAPGSEAGTDRKLHSGVRGGAIALLFGSFLGLTVTSVAYAIVGGVADPGHGLIDNPADPRAWLAWRVLTAGLHVIAGSAFGYSFLLLLAALRTLVVMAESGLEHLTYVVTAVIAPVGVYTYTCLGFLELLGHAGAPAFLWPILLFTGALLALALGFTTYFIRRPSGQFNKSKSFWASILKPTAISGLGAIVSTIAVLAVGILTYFDAGTSFGIYLMTAAGSTVLAILTAALVMYSIFVTRERYLLLDAIGESSKNGRTTESSNCIARRSDSRSSEEMAGLLQRESYAGPELADAEKCLGDGIGLVAEDDVNAEFVDTVRDDS